MGRKEMKEAVSAAKYKELESDYEEMKKKCEALVRGGDEMGKEILSLRRSVASYKSANTVLRRKVDGLEKDVERYKMLDSEGDELNEKKAEEIDSLRKALDEKDKVTSGLNAQVVELSQQVMGLKEKIVKKNADIQDLEASLEYEKLPWWKKLLMR